ncbi:hypothetical protein LOZ53_004488 [Ophidiomyces ophidiicola]|uniref:Uncharacterized protein n=1 Tax=Ophidiomyces ophidiicola TaxID=1387563 RepID=A0ACB8URC6_9EURO|nr:uncharacterized protein LOZ57_001157 [Ophidiomyces ophidiicola]KAI1916127.1 hypothetical protein LOZ64_003390 [Ophidiomyces ophidiicola]KAI1916937.1 hypothetical protein LOZ61_000840 [Ophidiomyces ophidiicola]KAI1924916.1 hypothetical protein LOZ60_004440 [Ophidiomyces ophidiicola]KAI1948684.1 hypothetical protein LOZ62_002633 [Ophidiomyces ophidiicola]KAI1951745.1 hypothetical protein LOZ57_001157 [Ophidiomyces ophidiicola]
MFFKPAVILAAVASFSSVHAAPTNATSTRNAAARAATWETHFGLTSSEFRDVSREIVADGLRLTYVSGYTDSRNRVLYTGLWERRSGSWRSTHNEDSYDFQRSFDRARDDGYRPILVNGYTVDSRARYEAIYDTSRSRGWEFRRDLSARGMQDAFDTLTDRGYRIVHINGYEVGREARYSGIWERGSDVAWESRFGLTSSQYQRTTEDLRNRGYRPVQVDGYTVNGNTYFAAIWDQSRATWESRHDMTPQQYQRELDTMTQNGFALKVVSGYPTRDGERFAAIWER